MTDESWLAGLKVGDEVAIPSHMDRNGPARIGVIERATDTSVWVYCQRFRRSDGKSMGDQADIYTVHLRPVNDKDRDAFKRTFLIRAILNRVDRDRDTIIPRVSTANLEAALALLTPESDHEPA